MSPFDGLHVLADDDPRWNHDPVAIARAACAGGAQVIQLRAKHATDRQALDWAREIRRVTRAAGARFVINDRFDWALACDADGVHLGQDDLPPLALPAAARARLAIGRSTHDEEQLRRAQGSGAAYLAFGPVFETTSKASADAARGVGALAAVCALAGPQGVVAIGGVGRDEIAAVRNAGARGAAVISAVAGAPDPAEATRALVAAWQGAA